MFEFTVSTLIAGFLFGVLGVYLLRKGTREANGWSLVIGATLLVYPYTVSDPWLVWGIGIGLTWLGWVKR